MTTAIDDLDARLIGLMRAEPNLPVIEMARRLDVARGTVQARLGRLHDSGVVTGYGPEVDAAASGYGVLALTTLEIAQGSGETIVAGLSEIPEVLEVFAITGPGDLHLRIAARSNQHLHEVLEHVLELPGIRRTETKLALHTSLRRTVADLIVSDAARSARVAR